MPRTTEQNQRMREATQARLLESAMVLFAFHGYAQASVRLIADHAGVSIGWLYHYFEGKEEVLRAVFAGTMEMLSAGSR